LSCLRVPGMIAVNETMRRHALASRFWFVLWDCFLGVPVKLLPIALLKSVFVDFRVGWIKPYLPFWMRLQISEYMKRLFKLPDSGHREVARQQRRLQKDIDMADLNCPPKLADEFLDALYAIGFQLWRLFKPWSIVARERCHTLGW
jgi:hypothetical protein